MRQFLFVFFFLSTTFSFGQKSDFRPFKMVIVSPDTAIIEEGLKAFADSIESDYLKGYNNAIKQMEDLLNCKDCPEDMKKRYAEGLKAAKQSEQEVKNFRFFEIISIYSSSVFQMYFNEYPPNSTFQVVRKKDLKSLELIDIAASYEADYVVSYRNIRTNKLNNGQTIMNLTTTLFGREGSKIIFEKQTTGDMNSYGDMWTCSNPLSCLLITSVKLSTTEIYEELSRRQEK
ncbi:MAG: hypothetical protein HYZ44_14665 [Bacteroidetes bacterium]|nr:hypothetical protein [Bacteroidota bacterium]